MKSLILLLFPILLLAQVPYPDTLTLTNGKIYSCLITGISDSKVDMVYLKNRQESVIFQAIGKISIETLGTVYISGKGFTQEKDYIKEFIDKRNKEKEDEQLIQNEIEKLALVSSGVQNETSNDIGSMYPYNQNSFKSKKWSFGVLLIPYYSGRVYSVIQYYGQNPPEVYISSFTDNEINMQGQLSYGLLSNIMLTLDVAYSSSYSEFSSEYHRRNEYEDYDSGIKTTNGLYMFDFTLGLKYYFLEFLPNNVNIYALLGLGQQFASAEVTEEDLYPGPEPAPIIEDNMAEYLEGMNSPWHLDFGFGVEYLFNESISLNSNIRFIYASTSSEYDYRYISEFETVSRSTEYSNSEFITRIGLGLNFYF